MFWNKRVDKKKDEQEQLFHDIAEKSKNIDPMEQVFQVMVSQAATDYRHIQDECKQKFEKRDYIIRDGMIEISGYTFCMGLSSIFEIKETQDAKVEVCEKIEGLKNRYSRALNEKASADGMNLALIGIVLNASRNNVIRTFQLPAELYGVNVSDIQLAIEWKICFPTQ